MSNNKDFFKFQKEVNYWRSFSPFFRQYMQKLVPLLIFHLFPYLDYKTVEAAT